jgi:hypothetical protein
MLLRAVIASTASNPASEPTVSVPPAGVGGRHASHQGRRQHREHNRREQPALETGLEQQEDADGGDRGDDQRP